MAAVWIKRPEKGSGRREIERQGGAAPIPHMSRGYCRAPSGIRLDDELRRREAVEEDAAVGLREHTGIEDHDAPPILGGADETAEALLTAIETELHQQMNGTFREDHCRIRKGNAPEKSPISQDLPPQSVNS